MSFFKGDGFFFYRKVLFIYKTLLTSSKHLTQDYEKQRNKPLRISRIHQELYAV